MISQDPNLIAKHGKTGENEKYLSNLDKKDAYKFDEALDVVGFGKFQIIIILVCGITLMTVINETMGMMIIGITSQCDLKTNSQLKGILGGISFIGIIISSHFWGYMSDTIGRRKVIMYSTFAANIFAFISCFISNFWLFVIVRLISGIFISGPSASLYAYLGEFHSVKFRPIAISFASIFVGISTAYISAMAWLILSMSWSIPIYPGLNFRPWRLLLFLYSAPGFIAAVSLLKLPESPKFLLNKHKEKEALNILERMFYQNCGEKTRIFPVRNLEKENSDLDNQVHNKVMSKKVSALQIINSMWNQTVPLFERPLVKNFLICSIVQFGLFFCSAGMGLWFPEIQNRLNSMVSDQNLTICAIIKQGESSMNINVDVGEIICDDSINPKVFMANIMLGSFYIIGYILLGVVINVIGRKKILLVVLFTSGISGFLLHWIHEPMVIAVLFSIFLMCSGLCVSIINGVVVDFVPTNIRGMAVCISLMMGRLGSVVGSNLVGALLDVNCSLTFSIFSGFITFCAILTSFLP